MTSWPPSLVTGHCSPLVVTTLRPNGVYPPLYDSLSGDGQPVAVGGTGAMLALAALIT